MLRIYGIGEYYTGFLYVWFCRCSGDPAMVSLSSVRIVYSVNRAVSGGLFVTQDHL
jgi:hypothetical protein